VALGRAACAGPAVPGALCRELPLGTGCAESNEPCAEWFLLSAEARIPVVIPEGPKRFTDIFRNLKHIKIRNLHEECGLSWISFLLQASPCLKELHIKVHCLGFIEYFDRFVFDLPTRRSEESAEIIAHLFWCYLTRVVVVQYMHPNVLPPYCN
jgi:hypothetical protein